ncbi:MAG: protein translocase subunit SecF [Bradymonadaceae bacterium]|nr:protein translocase subunit SecF [Lujinxingiaceae bacterium]
MKMFQIVSNDININFIGNRKIGAMISALMVLVSLVLIFTVGPRYGIDFRGGTEMILAFQGPVTDDEVRQAAIGIGLTDAGVQRFGAVEDRRFLLQTQEVSVVDATKIREVEEKLGTLGTLQRATWSPEQPDRYDLLFESHVAVEDIREAVLSTGLQRVDVEATGQAEEARYVVRFQDLQEMIKRGFAAHFNERFVPETGLERLETVGPRVGEQLRNSGILSVLIALLAILVYIWFRFDVRYSPGAVVALAHDITIAVGVFVAIQHEITLPIIAALLTIVGYSLNDTIVIFDRIRENLDNAGTKPVEEVVNKSLNECLSRTLITSGTTLLAVTAIAIIGTGLIQDFAVALIIGICVGTYSSIFVASPLMVKMDQYLRDRKKASELLDAAQARNITI